MLFRLKGGCVLQNLPIIQKKLVLRSISSLNLWDKELTSEVKHRIEQHWRDKIKTPIYDEQCSDKEKYYVLSMFPYPSGHLHMGHVRVYTISDAVARFQRMNGKNVIHPTGWDAFGLPAENAAIERQISPDDWTEKNIEHMKNQLQTLGCSFEWHRELATCHPQYYRWTQDLFLKLYEAGLAYQKEALVNWDPVDKTVLAHEQVDENGCSWRSGAKVEKKLLKQWFIRTTKFAKDLLEGLDDSVLHDWKDIIKLQKHWIGECDGVNFDFKIKENSDEFVSLWINSPELVNDVKFVAVKKDHILARQENITGLNGTKKLSATLLNPFNNKEVPVFVSNDVEFLPFTDSYVGIPGLNEEAARFAHKNKIKFTEIDAQKSEEEIKKVREEVIGKAKELNIGGYWTSAKLRDWLISRQRYWGTPIPIIHCPNCGTRPVPKENLPVVLPKLKKLSVKGVSQLAEIDEWVTCECPKCKGPAKRETDTMDTFVDSSWYYLRFLDAKNDKEMFGRDKAMTMSPVDLYIGGKEHAVLHLYYARFIAHFLHSLGLLPEREPFKRLLVQGMVMGRSYRIKGTGEYLPESKVNIIDLKRNKAETLDTKEPVVIAWEKMSKSKHNGVDPEDMFREYGVDTTRLLILADVAPTSHRNWNSNTFPGILNWQRRLWLTVQQFIQHRKDSPPMAPEDEFKSQEDYLFDSRNYYVKGTSFNYVISQQMSVAVSKQQGLTNSLRRAPPAVFAHSLQFERALAAQIILLAPMAPYFASELWAGFLSAPNRISDGELFWDRPVLEQKWPETDMDYKLELICQVNGHENCCIKIPRKDLDILSKEEAVRLALSQKEVCDVLATRNVLDTVYKTYSGNDCIINFIAKSQQHMKEKVEKSN
ncbi:unnamed protein product [Brassicogethes aeneus]|uniref:leucine--tRNA ligase n=1 Tax=Brassicogethes aeneus TaxID=1431903 RepID=A0A9P0AP79_BRAAE|nr:unnamed protein product [Brassicogethes aeneus]